jgi:hypothetical protein
MTGHAAGWWSIISSPCGGFDEGLHEGRPREALITIKIGDDD